jgi:hypothetical protein
MKAPALLKPATLSGQNDLFRSVACRQVFGVVLLQKAGLPGRVVITPGVAALPTPSKWQVLQAISAFDQFTKDNDPHREHDFGSFTLETRERLFWKIDYYENAECEYGAEKPETGCYRVLTIMLAEEY